MDSQIPDQMRSGYHGETKGRIDGGLFVGTEVYLSHSRDLAENYSEGEGKVYLVKYTGKNPLILDTSDAFSEAWKASGAGQVKGKFHPDQTREFAGWARRNGYDAIIIPESAFEGELGYEMVGGTVGEPQTIVLYPELTRILEEYAPQN
jgi:hypothetical protein